MSDNNESQLKTMFVTRMKHEYIAIHFDKGYRIDKIKESAEKRLGVVIENNDISYWDFLCHAYEINEKTDFKVILECLAMENLFKPDPNSTVYRALESIMKRSGSDSVNLLEELFEEADEVDIEALNKAL